MSEEANKKTVEEFFEAGNRGDMEACFGLIADDVTWTNVGSTSLSGTYRGKTELMEKLLGPLFGRLEAGIRSSVPQARLNGHPEQRLPNTLNMTLPGMRGESLVLFLDRYGVFFSSGSACKSGNPDPSHVLRAMGLSDEDAHCAIRMSLGVGNSEADIEYVLESLAAVIGDRQSSVKFIGCR